LEEILLLRRDFKSYLVDAGFLDDKGVKRLFEANDEIDGDSDDDVDQRQLSYADYKLGDFISFKKSPQSPISYAVISEILPDNAEGKSYDIIYCDTGRPDDSLRSNPTTTSGLRENISPFLQTIPVYFRHYDGQFRGLEEVTKIQNPQEIPSEILTELQGAFNTRPGRFVTPEPSPFNTRDNSTNSSNSRSSSSSISRNSSSGGKRYRKKKNKTKRRNRKTKNRKSKRR
jgi:hypothetical protein